MASAPPAAPGSSIPPLLPASAADVATGPGSSMSDGAAKVHAGGRKPTLDGLRSSAIAGLRASAVKGFRTSPSSTHKSYNQMGDGDEPECSPPFEPVSPTTPAQDGANVSKVGYLPPSPESPGTRQPPPPLASMEGGGSPKLGPLSPKQVEDWAIAGGVGVGAVFGTVARYYLHDAIKPWAAESGALSADWLPNFAGCLLMGTFAALKPRLQPPHPTIFSGVTTGFCGCCTTYSAYTAFVGVLWTRGHVLQALMCGVFGAATAYAGLKAGLTLGGGCSGKEPPPGSPVGVRPQQAAQVKQAQCLRAKFAVYWTLIVAAAVTCAVLFAHVEIQWPVIGACVAPVGAWTRWSLGKNNRPGKIPWWTLLCNVVASALSALFAGLLGKGGCNPAVFDAEAKHVIKGLSLGFCGGLSTVSTLADETRRLAEENQRRAWVYFALTIAGGQAVCAVALFPLHAAYGCD